MSRTIYKTRHNIPLYKYGGQFITEWEATMLAEKGAAIVEEVDDPYEPRTLDFPDQPEHDILIP